MSGLHIALMVGSIASAAMGGVCIALCGDEPPHFVSALVFSALTVLMAFGAAGAIPS